MYNIYFMQITIPLASLTRAFVLPSTNEEESIGQDPEEIYGVR